MSLVIGYTHKRLNEKRARREESESVTCGAVAEYLKRVGSRAAEIVIGSQRFNSPPETTVEHPQPLPYSEGQPRSPKPILRPDSYSLTLPTPLADDSIVYRGGQIPFSLRNLVASTASTRNQGSFASYRTSH